MTDDRDLAAVGRRGFLAGATAAATATAATGVAAQEDDENDGDDDVVTVELGDYYYEPGTDSPLEITPGTTVRFVWITDTHNIVLLDQPEESEWDGVEEIYDAGHEYEFTFEVEGTYEFVCVPHEGLGMFGTIIVDEDAGEDVEVLPDIPPEAMTLGIATSFALVATLGFAYVFLKYGGGAPPEE